MIKGKTIVAVVPARGGSKGVELKNIHPLLGRPLLAYTGDVIRETGYFDRAIVSTDHFQIAEVAQDIGLDVPFYRPDSLSGDRISDYDVLNHALKTIEQTDNKQYDIVVMLQPTCPLRTKMHVNTAIIKLIEEHWDAVWTVSVTDLKYHPLKQLVLTSDGKLNHYSSQGSTIIARQQLNQVYYRNGAAYVFTRDCLLNEKTTLPKRTGALILDDAMVSIDTLDDFTTVEQLLRVRK